MADKKATRESYGAALVELGNKYDFLVYDVRSGGFRYDDSYLFSVDLNAGTSAQREVMWQKNLENLIAGTLGDKGHPSTLLRYWQCQERAHYPHARENVEYFMEMLKKGGDIDEGERKRSEAAEEE